MSGSTGCFNFAERETETDVYKDVAPVNAKIFSETPNVLGWISKTAMMGLPSKVVNDLSYQRRPLVN